MRIRVFKKRLNQTVEEIALDVRRKLIRGEVRTAARLRRLFAASKRKASQDLKSVLRLIDNARAVGVEPSPTWLLSQDRYQTLIRQIDAEMQKFGNHAASTTETKQLQLIQNGKAMANSQIASVHGSFVKLPKDALLQLAGRLSDGTPLAEKFRTFGMAAARKAEEAIFTGMANGQGSREIARGVQNALGGTFWDALRIARTESLNSFRAATLESYRQNTQLIKGYVRVAAKDGRVCPACLALDGQEAHLGEGFDMHPACRCSVAPRFVEVDHSAYMTGDQWLPKQTEDMQIRILGRAGQKLYANGEVELKDFVKITQHPRYGRTISEKPLKEILADKQLRLAA